MKQQMISRIEKIIDEAKTTSSTELAKILVNASAILPKFPVYSTVYIVDKYDVDNDCSNIGNGSGSKNIIDKVRECFITSYVVSDNGCNLIYYVQPRQLTEKEYDGTLYFYWGRGRYEKDIYLTKEEAAEAILNPMPKINKSKITRVDLELAWLNAFDVDGDTAEEKVKILSKISSDTLADQIYDDSLQSDMEDFYDKEFLIEIEKIRDMGAEPKESNVHITMEQYLNLKK